MEIYNGLQEVILRIIETIEHPEGMTSQERFKAVMQALFGSYYADKSRKPPAGFTEEDMAEIMKLWRGGLSQPKSIQQVVAKRLPGKSVNDETMRIAAVGRIKQELYRYKDYYAGSGKLDYSMEDHALSAADEAIRKNVLEAARLAEWY